VLGQFERYVGRLTLVAGALVVLWVAYEVGRDALARQPFAKEVGK